MNDRNLFKNSAEAKRLLKGRSYNHLDFKKLEDLLSENVRLQNTIITKRTELNKAAEKIHLLLKEKRLLDAEEQKISVQKDKASLKSIEEEQDNLSQQIDIILFRMPNILHEDVPIGLSDEDNKIIKVVGDTKLGNPNFTHVEIGERLGIFDFERAAKLSGARFSILKGFGPKLERAISTFFLEHHTASGYQEVAVPFIVNKNILEGTGQLPKFQDDLFMLSDGKQYLIPTAEVPVTNMFRDEILLESQLPLKLVSLTPCFRAESGKHGVDVRGLIRQHQFNKVELVMIDVPEKGLENHEALILQVESCLTELELPYRLVQHCSADVSFSASRCFDFEVWMPSANKYREVSSVSWFKDFQSRRMNMRYRPGDKGKPVYPHTLNGSGLAVGRTLAAILENYVQEDGSLLVPKVLRRYLGCEVLK